MIDSKKLVALFLDFDDFRQSQHFALHTVDALDENQDLAPRPIVVRLAVCNRVAHDALEVFWIVVLEDAHRRVGRSTTDDKRRVIVGVGDDQAALADERRQRRRVGRIAHAKDDGVFVADKGCNLARQLDVHAKRAAIAERRASRRATVTHVLRDGVDDRALVLGEAKVVVRAEVQRANRFARRAKRHVVVVALALDNVEIGARTARNRSIPAVADARVKISVRDRACACACA